MSEKVSKAKAEAVLEAVKAQHATWLEPMVLDTMTLDPLPGPVLVDRDDRWEVVWEEGPDEWVFTLNGGSGEEDRCLAAAAAEEFGVKYVEPVRKPAKMPEGVYVEPVNHVVLAVYPA